MGSRRTQRGMGLVATMLVLMGILTLTLVGLSSGGGGKGYGGLIGTAGNALQASGARTRSAASFNMAESGLQYTMAWLSAQSQPPNTSVAFAPTLWGATAVGTRAKIVPDAADPSSYFSVRVYPDRYNNDVSSATSTQKKYLIESVGVSGGITTIVQAYVGQQSLSQYLVLLNSWNNSGNYWVSGLTTFDGPVHDNNIGPDGHGANGDTQTPDGTPENILWKSAKGTAPMFTYTGDDAYSVSSPTGIAWWKDQFNTSAAPQVLPDGTNQWLNVAAGGAGTVKQGTPVVPFPTSSNLQRSVAIGSAGSLNTSGVTLCAGGGIYIEGNVDEMVMSAAGTGNATQVITVTQGTTVQRITIDPVNGVTLETQKPNGSWNQVATQPGGVNGVVYCNGNIGAQGDPKTGGLHGQVADNLLDASGNLLHANGLTVATPQTANCNVDGSITYSTKRQVAKDSSGNPMYIDVDGKPTSDPAKGTPVYMPEDKDTGYVNSKGVSRAGTLGLISNDVKVTKKDSTGADLTNFEMDGTVLASGIYDADHFTDRAVGLWENMGGYLSSTVGTFGTFDNNSLKLTNGFNTQFNYDARMRNTPPPFFPTTGNQYNIISWQQVKQTLE